MKQPLVSVIVTTKNNETTIAECLASIRRQTYENIELIVVDNSSTDSTAKIASGHADKVFKKGPERSAQRNFGVSKSKGTYVLIIDSDMELTSDVITECVEIVTDKTQAIVIPEESFGDGFWAQCKKLERSFYIGVDWIEAPRFFSKKLYTDVGGYNEKIAGGEDWELRDRIKGLSDIGRVDSIIKHNEGKLNIYELVTSRIYYSRGFNQTMKAYSGANHVINTYKLFFANYKKLIKNPVLGLGMLIMKTIEYAVAVICLISLKFSKI